jgi:arsenate reductase-like glutaredoxin family protein
MAITIYHSPGCGTSRNALAALSADGDQVAIHLSGPTEPLKSPTGEETNP